MLLVFILKKYYQICSILVRHRAWLAFSRKN